MLKKIPGVPPKPIWAYAYELIPPQPEERFRPVRTMLEREHEEAARGARTWVGSLVAERQLTHILVLSDSPEQDLEINRTLEAKLTELKATFSITAPMRVAEDVEDPPH
jgi:hypothetical protein